MDRSSALVAFGILCSRLTGFIRQRFFAQYFGLSDSADAFMAAFRIPNFLQNLFGEGALSASFIPVYAALVAREEREEAARVAGGVAALLALVTGILVLLGVLATPLLVALIAPGFEGEKRQLTIAIVRILFPGAGFLVLSAWCLGILNSHRRFLLSYIAPVTWNVSMIVALVWWGNVTPLPRLAVILAFSALAGSALQMLVQLPAVLTLVPNLRLRLELSEHVRATVRNFVPVFVSRGVVQISAYIDAVLASLLPTGAVTGLANAQLLYTLPVSLFGLSVSAAALPAMSGAVGLDAMEVLRDRLNTGLRHIAFFVVPSAVGFLALGDVVAAALFQTGRFTYADAVYVWAVLAGSSIGLAGNHAGAAVFLDVLRAAGHTDAVAVRTRSRRHCDSAWLPCRDCASADDGNRAGMGNRGFDDGRQYCWLDRAAAAASIAESAHRPDRLAPWPRRTSMGGCLHRSRGRMGNQTDITCVTPDSAGDADSDAIRCRVSGIDGRVRG